MSGFVYTKYDRKIVGKNDTGECMVDVYNVLKAFNVTCPALQHLIKKALCVGIRGHKDETEDLQNIVGSANRALELIKEVPKILTGDPLQDYQTK